MDKFVQTNSPTGISCKRNITMGYFDGNTVTALWNYAQHFAMSDNFFGSTFGPSTPGALNLVSGQTHGATPTNISDNIANEIANGIVIGDPDPANDDCSNGDTVSMHGKNIGDLMNHWQHPLQDNLQELPLGIHAIQSRPNDIALDYIRGNIVDPRLFIPIPMNLPGPDNDLNEKLTTTCNEQWPTKIRCFTRLVIHGDQTISATRFLDFNQGLVFMISI